MDGRIGRWWRIAGTGSAFALFGIGGLALTVFAFPIMSLLPGDRSRRERRVQRLIYRCFGIFMTYMRVIGLSDVRVRGLERLREPGGHLLVANHPTLLDVVILGALLPQLDCVVKRESWSNPFMSGVVASAGYISNDSGVELVESCVERLRSNRSLLIFPEGTRSPKGGLGPLHRGAAHTALRSGRPLTPIFIRCDPPTLMRGQKWHDVPPCRMQFSIEIGDSIALPSPQCDDPRGAAARRITEELRDFFEKRLQYPAI
jgi:1-acyl-sn-glycerol-3-phosphate acyltransferase